MNFRFVQFAQIFLLLISLAACQNNIPLERGRVISPSGQVDAVLVEWVTGAMGEFSFGIVLVDHGEKLPDEVHPSLVISSLEIANLHWISGKLLEVQYADTAQIYSFHNRWYSSTNLADTPPQPFEIFLKRQSLLAMDKPK